MKNLTSTGKLTKEYKEYLEKVRKESIENGMSEEEADGYTTPTMFLNEETGDFEPESEHDFFMESMNELKRLTDKEISKNE